MNCRLWCAVFVTVSVTVSSFASDIIINEIMYHPSSQNPREEYIELHNPGTNSVPLQGWRISKGVDFTITNEITLAPGGYLVIAADLAAFQAKYPTVTNVIGGWTGALANSGEEVEIENALGENEDSVIYANEGDWAIRQRGPLFQNGHRGWVWLAEHAGLGRSLEVVNPRASNNSGQNWLSSAAFNGTPGRANSVARANIAPIISEVQHLPGIPKSTDVVAITAMVEDELASGVTVTLFHRVASDGEPPGFSMSPMFDDGQHNDGLAGDLIYGIVLPAQPHLTVTEFFVQASDGQGNARTWPAAARQEGGSFEQTANALFQVDDGVYAGPQPVVRLVMTEAERAELAQFSIRQTDAQMNTTFIHRDGTGTQVRYNCGVRIRGAGSRNNQIPNYRLNIPVDRRWKDVDEVNLNAQFPYLQVLGSGVAQRAGLPAANVRATQVRVNGRNLVSGNFPYFGSYALVEVINRDYAANHFPTDSGGNLYRGSTGQHSARLDYLGADPQTYRNAGYDKASNSSEDDWTDLFELTRVLSAEPDATYAQRVREVANVELWMRYFAIFTLLQSMETSMGTGRGDDYAMYRGLIDTRFILLPHDLDTIFGGGDTPRAPNAADIFRMVPAVGWPVPGTQPANVTILNRFMLHPEFVPLYFSELKRLAETVFASGELNPLVDQLLGGFVPGPDLDAIKNFALARNAFVLSQIPQALTATSTLALSNGIPRTTNATTTLTGTAPGIETRSVRVNGNLAAWTAWQGSWTITNLALRPGINRVLVQALDAAGDEVAQRTIDIWYDDGSVTTVGGVLASDATWSPEAGPYVVSSTLTVPTGRTLTIQPGTTIFLGGNVSLNIANGGRLLAQGTETAPIRFGRVPGGAAWGGLNISGGPGSPETVISHAHIEGNSGTAVNALDATLALHHLTFGTTTQPYVSVDRCSFIISDCVFPRPTAQFEMVHANGGIMAGGRGVIARSFFGAANGYNDTIDFTGGNRPGPILHVIDNVFMGSDDDLLDLDSTDAWVEGNIFMHAHRNGATPDSASAVSGGSDTADRSQITIIGNIFYDCDQAALAKQGNFYTMINNTVVRQTRVGGVDTDAGVIIMADDGTAEGAGFYLEGNLIYDAEKLVRNQTASIVTFSNNLMPFAWAGPGGGNFAADPRLKHIPQLSQTTGFTTWQQAQVLKDWFSLRPGSPARGVGPNGVDLGGVIPLGVSISGEPEGTTSSGSATLRIGINRAVPGFPQGSGYTHYRWRLNGSGSWSAETPIDAPISLTGLADGEHYVEVSGKRDSGLYQDDPAFGPVAVVTRSRTWTVNSSFSGSLVINEVLARNTAGPDLIELHNGALGEIELSGMGLSDDPLEPFKFKFAVDTFLGAGQFLVLEANDEQLGFALNQRGSGVYLFSREGLLIDSVVFGAQVPDLSLARDASGAWTLAHSTFGAANRPAALGEPFGLMLNEWLAEGSALFPDDFIELYNSEPLPVALGGLFLSDVPETLPQYYQIPPLSFIAGHGHLAFGEELPFRLDSEQGSISVSSSNGIIDYICYGPQTSGLAEGRRPSGAIYIDRFSPTPNAPNPGIVSDVIVTNITIGLMSLTNTWRYEASGTDLGTTWRAPDFDDSTWQSGPALLYNENNTAVPFRNTFLPFTTPRQTTFYFRTRFVIETNLAAFGLRGLAFLDDGAVLYLNGTEVLRVRMPTGEINYSTLANGSPQDGDAVLETLLFPSTALLPGTNVLAVEVHQQLPTSSDIVWGMALEATRSITNIVAASVVLNEVMSNNRAVTNADGSVTDWVELHNPVSVALDLADQSLTDDVNNPRRWVFPPGATIPAGGYLVVRFDPDLPPSTNAGAVLNTGFGLDLNGDEVLLFDAPARGGALLDSVEFGLQVRDYSIGRAPGWSLTLPTPGSINIPANLGSPAAVKVNEWMAVPSSGDDWFELFNPNHQPVAIGGLHLTDDLNNLTKFQIPPLSFISHSTNGFVQFLADDNTQNGPDHVNFRLNNGGEWLAIVSATGQIIHAVRFERQAAGVSEGSLPDGTGNLTRFPSSASPAESNYLPLDQIAISEALTHTDLPMEDAIELHNLTDETIDIGGWFMSDSVDDLQVFRIPPGTLVPARSFVVFYEHQLNPDPEFIPGFALSSSRGDDIHLAEATLAGELTGYRTAVKFGAAENGVSFGRHETSEAVDFPAQVQRTIGVSNSYPKVGPVVITEIMYHPPDIGGTNDNVPDEFIEVQNISAAPVDLGGWRMRDAVDYNFPSNTTIALGSYLLLVSFDPIGDPVTLAAFTAKYSVGGGVLIRGPYRGKLDNSRDSIELVKPDAPPPGEQIPYVLVDKVRYSDVAPWPSAADLGKASLQRRNAAAYGNDPVNWLAGIPTAGAATGPPLFPHPQITTQPVGATVTPGTSVTLFAEMTGEPPMSFQWRRNGTDIPGANGPFIVIPSAQAANAGTYRLRVSNPYGATITEPAALVLRLPPEIIRQPQSIAIATGGTATFNVQARGTPPLQYHWRFHGNNFSGATSFEYEATVEGPYDVVIANSFGAITSMVATLVMQEPPAIGEHPASQTVLAGATVTLTGSASGSEPLTYQWRIDGANIPGANSPTLVIPNIQPAQSGRYTLRVNNTVGAAISQTAVISVLVPPTVEVLATDPSATEIGDPGLFEIVRIGTTNFALTVNLARSGSANPGADFSALPAAIDIPAGVTGASIPVTPINDSEREALETVTLQITAGAGYAIGPRHTATITILDDDNASPTISIAAPAQLSMFPFTPANVQFAVNAADADGTVGRVDYYHEGTNHLGAALASPFGFTWTNAVPGTNRITAVATDDLGGVGASPPLTFFVNFPPKAAITSPPDGTVFPPGSNIVLRASVSDADGVVARVEFFEGETSLGVVSNAPFILTWSTSLVDIHRIHAVATDDRGQSSVSAPINIIVRVPNNNFADMFEDRGDLSGFVNVVSGSNTTASRQPNEPPAYAGSTRTVWLRWVAPATGLAYVYTLGSTFDTVLAVFTNNPPHIESLTNLGLVVENDDFEGLQSLVSFQASEDIPYQIRVEGFGAASGNIVLTQVLPARNPRILVHPQSVLVATGSTANFTFQAVATEGYTNQWRLNGTNLPNAAGATLAVANVLPGKDGDYTVLVGNAFGFDISQPARLEIGARPRVVVQPVSVTAVEGSSALISATVTGTLPMTYRWRRAGIYVHEYTTNSLTGFISFPSVTTNDAGSYAVAVTNILGPAPQLSQSATLTVLADSDRDGAPNQWEILYGFEPNDGDDGFLDADGDGMINWHEYVAGTHPRDAASYLKVTRLAPAAGQATVTFSAVSNRTYTVQFTDALGSLWNPLQNVPSRTTNRVVSVIDAAAPSTRFYRLAIP